MEIFGEISKKISTLARNGEKFLFIIDFEGKNAEIFTPEQAMAAGVQFQMDTTPLENSTNSTGIQKTFATVPINYDDYLQAFNKVQKALKRGDTYLLNLTFRTEISTGYSLMEIYQHSRARFKLLYKDKFVVFSPERFIKISNGIIETNPMKGTIDATIPNAESLLLDNRKELFEHNTIVDLLRNDLSIVADDVTVEKFRYVEKVTTHRGELLQVSSKIVGKLPDNYLDNLGEIIFKLLPAGSVTGAPKEKTVQIIKDVENYDRGFYTGVFGYFDGKDLDVAVSIRFIEKEGDKLYFKSGGGITSLSNPVEEYNELQNKVYVPII